MGEPAFLAVTRTPSMAPSSADVTLPISDASAARDASAFIASTNVRQTLATHALRLRIVNPPSEICMGVPPRSARFGRLWEDVREPSPGRARKAPKPFQ